MLIRGGKKTQLRLGVWVVAVDEEGRLGETETQSADKGLALKPSQRRLLHNLTSKFPLEIVIIIIINRIIVEPFYNNIL